MSAKITITLTREKRDLGHRTAALGDRMDNATMVLDSSEKELEQLQ